MIPLIITITSYNKSTNDCQAMLQNGNIITLDPFVGCAIPLSDEDYEDGKGADIIGNHYLMKEYSVRDYCVVPYENGLIKLEGHEIQSY